jgi:hypothetical protein
VLIWVSAAGDESDERSDVGADGKVDICDFLCSVRTNGKVMVMSVLHISIQPN